MQTEIVSVQVGGSRYTAWEMVSVEGSVKEACRHFHLHAAAIMGGDATNALFQVFTPISIYATGDLIFTGYIDSRRPHIDAHSAYFTISGRSKGQDAVDASAMHKTGHFEKKTPLDIAKALDKAKIGFSSDTELEKIPSFQLQPGETLFRCIERACRDQGVTLAGLADGGIKLTKAGATAHRQGGALIQGVNIKCGDAHFCSRNRHSKIFARGQSYDGHGPQALQMEETAEDKGAKRERPWVLVQDGNTDKKRLKKRAENRRDKAAGDGIRASITTAGWRDDGGGLWEPGNKVWVESPFLGLAQDMLIEHCHYRQGRDTEAVLSLVDPRAHGGQGGGANESGGEWGF